MPTNNLHIPEHLRRPKDLNKRKLMGNYQRNCVNLLEYQSTNPNNENSPEYKRLEYEVSKSRDAIFTFQPSLSSLFPDKNDFPMVDGQNVKLPDLADLMGQAQEISYEKLGYKDKNNQDLNLDSVVHEITIPTLQLDKDGKPAYNDDGDIQFQEETFFALKGNNIDEVKNNFQSLFNTISEKSENSISQLREEMETFSSIMPESHDYDESGYKSVTPDYVISLEKFFGKNLKDLSNTTIQSEVLNSLGDSMGQKALKKHLSVINYTDNVNKYVKTVMEENEGRGLFGHFLQDTNINYVNNGKIEKALGRNAFCDILFNEVSKNLIERTDLANKNGNAQDLALFENTFGNNPMANDMFNQILSESADSAMRTLSKYNNRIPQETFTPNVLPNLAPPAPSQPNFYERMSNPDTFADSLMNPRGTVDNLLGHNNNPAPQLDGYGRPIYNQPQQSDFNQEQQAQLPNNLERTVDNLVKDIPYTPQYGQNNSMPNNNSNVSNPPSIIDLKSIIL